MFSSDPALPHYEDYFLLPNIYKRSVVVLNTLLIDFEDLNRKQRLLPASLSNAGAGI
jgi:hypothetical protein